MRTSASAAIFFAIASSCALAQDAKPTDPIVIGRIEVTDKKQFEDLAKAFAAGLCTYHGTRIICPQIEQNVAVQLDIKPAK